MHTRISAARLVGSLVVTALVATCAVVAAQGYPNLEGTHSLVSGKTFYFIPKDTLNPYEVIADHGGKLALDAPEEQAGRLVRHPGHRRRSAAIDPGGDPVERRRHRDRRQRSRRRLPVAEAGDGEGHRGRGLRLRHELPPALHQPGGHRDDRPQPDQAPRTADGLQGPVRDPLGRVDRDEPERLDQVHEAGAEEAGLQEHEAGQDLLRQRQPGPVAPGDGVRCSRPTRT